MGSTFSRTRRSVFGLVCFFIGCAAIGVQAIVAADIIEAPLAVAFPSADQVFPALHSDDGSAFYVYASNERIELAGAPLERQDGEMSRLVYEMADGRTATITLSDGPDETIRVTFTVDAKGEYEKLGVQFRVGETEGFYGLMERVVQGSQGYSWEPGMTEGLDLRGQVVDLYTLPTLSIYAPFFLSSAGYGVLVEGDWPAVYRFGADGNGRTAPTELTIESEGPVLSFLLLPGPTPTDVIERYARLTGLPLLPPDFLFGPSRWRDEVWDLPTFYDGTPYDGPYNSMIVEDVLMMDALDIPCSWIVIDRPWASGSFEERGAREVGDRSATATCASTKSVSQASAAWSTGSTRATSRRCSGSGRG
ncbi:hypothetical protein ACFLSF_03035 [Candidatus Bipolaricaulota bacterium]